MPNAPLPPRARERARARRTTMLQRRVGAGAVLALCVGGAIAAVLALAGRPGQLARGHRPSRSASGARRRVAREAHPPAARGTSRGTDAAPAARAARGSRGGTRRLPHRARGRAHGTGHVGERDRRGELRLDHPAGPAPGGTARRAGGDAGPLRVRLRRRRRGPPARSHPAHRPAERARAPSGSLPAASSDAAARRSAVDRLRRRRLHGHALARHDRRIPAGQRRARRRPSARRRCATPPSPRRAARLVIAGGSLAERIGARAPSTRFDPRTRRASRDRRAARADDTRRRRRLGGTVLHHRRARRRSRHARQPRSSPIDPGTRPHPTGRTLCAPLARPRGGRRSAGAIADRRRRDAGRRTPRSARSPGAPRTRRSADAVGAPTSTPPTGANMLTGAARARARALVYVPNSQSNTVDVIDQRTFKVVDHFAVGALPAARHAVVGPEDAVRRQRPRATA